MKQQQNRVNSAAEQTTPAAIRPPPSGKTAAAASGSREKTRSAPCELRQQHNRTAEKDSSKSETQTAHRAPNGLMKQSQNRITENPRQQLLLSQKAILRIPRPLVEQTSRDVQPLQTPPLR